MAKDVHKALVQIISVKEIKENEAEEFLRSATRKISKGCY